MVTPLNLSLILQNEVQKVAFIVCCFVTPNNTASLQAKTSLRITTWIGPYQVILQEKPTSNMDRPFLINNTTGKNQDSHGLL